MGTHVINGKIYHDVHSWGRFWQWWRHETPINPLTLLRDCRYFIQRGRRGWSDRDLWDLGSYLSELLEGALSAQNAERHTHFTFPHPADEAVGPWEDQYHINHEGDATRTDEVYVAMIDGFKAARAILDLERLDGQPFDPMYRFDAEYEMMNKGLDLFKEYFLGLWD